MRVNKTIYLLGIVFISIAMSAHADSPVWKVSKGNNHLYLGGTIHLLGKNDYPLPRAFEKTYKVSSRLVFETDMHKFQSPEFQKAFMKKITYSGDRSLKDILSKKNITALEKHFTDRGLTFEPMLQFKPGMLVMMLTVMEMKRLNIGDIGVDQFYINKGLKDGKKFTYLESVEEQLSFIVNMGENNPDELVTYTLRDMKNLGGQIAVMKSAWRKGDNLKLKEVALTPWQKDFPQLYNTLLVERNNKWIPKIEAMLKTNEVEFVMFGALHMVGDDGVLAQLKARGYSIQKQ
ncbi:MAG: TraB/GumN family protein [Gammaproteobacteria bacterium]|nr:TraB/GumN family protein [Gammaproteobacteria bacterium]MCW8988668.1 TraB/GumN family protein [Gammaproteobacteria bacterium]MCW9032035.1 TraB/GumN family protein [Gammaproteobacteria bacterium]